MAAIILNYIAETTQEWTEGEKGEAGNKNLLHTQPISQITRRRDNRCLRQGVGGHDPL